MSVQMSLQRSHTVSSAKPALSRVSIAARTTHASPLTRRQHHHICRAETSETPPATTSSEQQQPQQPQQTEQPAAPSAPLLAPGQGTAIVTGAISIIFGIAYLVLVSILDMRGGELQPPPPEAFMQ